MQITQANRFAKKLVENNGVCNRQGKFKWSCVACPIINTTIYVKYNHRPKRLNVRHICTSKITLDWDNRYLKNNL